MFGYVFQQQLQGAGDDEAGRVFGTDVLPDRESFREPDFQEFVIHGYETDFLIEADEFLSVVLQHVTVDAREFVDITAGPFLVPVLDDGVEDVEGIEQEMRIDLVLEGHVPEFGQVPLLLLGGQFVADVDGVFDHVGDAENRHLHKNRDDDVAGEGGRIDGNRPMEGEPEGVGKGAEDGHAPDEQGRPESGEVQVEMLPVPETDEEEGAGEHEQQYQGIAQERAEFTAGIHPLEGPFPEDEQFHEKAEGEDGDNGEDEPAQVLFPGFLPVGGRMIGAGEQVQRPAEDFGGQERGEDMAQQGGRQAEHLRAEVAQDVAEDVRQDDIDGGEFHRKAALQADQDRHEHRQDGKDQGIRDAGVRAQDGHHGMQRRESVDDISRPDLFHRHC